MSRQSSDDDDCAFSLAAATYNSHSSDIVDVPIGFLNKAQSECDHTRNATSNAAHSCDSQPVSCGSVVGARQQVSGRESRSRGGE